MTVCVADAAVASSVLGLLYFCLLSSLGCFTVLRVTVESRRLRRLEGSGIGLFRLFVT